MARHVLVLGGGGREHALAVALKASQNTGTIYVSPGNAGTSEIATNVALNVKNHEEILNFCRGKKVSMVVVGPEDPLDDGLTNSLRKGGVPTFGPSQAAAKIESSKSWSKDFMKRHGIPTGDYRSFQGASEAKEFIQNSEWTGYVIKASGLAAGKGVIVTETKDEALKAVDEVAASFGAAADVILVEERLLGEEASVLCFTDGMSVAVMPPAQDHKRLRDGDEGPNTGGMGAFAPCPLVTPKDLVEVKEKVLQRAVDGLRKEGHPFVGVLYAGIIMTKNGFRVLEFNCRFGDPETQVILPLLRTDFLHVVEACVEGRLAETDVVFDSDKTCVAVCVVSGGYPGSYPKGKAISGLSEVTSLPNHRIYHAGTRRQDPNDSVVVTSGGRVLAVSVLEPSLEEAARLATAAADKIKFDGAFFRRDIARKGIIRKTTSSGKLTYRSSGVSIDAGDALVRAIKGVTAATHRPGVLGSIGSFGGLFDLKETPFAKDAILVAGADGVGTKLKIAQCFGVSSTVGEDLVAMCVNDVLTHGAEPLFFLDYFATGRLQVGVAASVVEGVARGCQKAGCALLGGETAEMPGMYGTDEYDLAGFAVGAVDRAHLLPRSQEMVEGDILLGLESSGLHSNGFSLVRKIVDTCRLDLTRPAPFNTKTPLGEELLTPTRIYVQSTLKALTSGLVKGAVHVTGGGLTENLPRVLPEGLGVVLDARSWELHPVFAWISCYGVTTAEMSRTFNCGLGLVLVVAKDKVEDVKKLILEYEPKVVGRLVQWTEGKTRVQIDGLDEVLETGRKPLLVRGPVLPQKRRVGVLISGSGTNLQALIDHASSSLSAAQIAVVISNVAGVRGLQRAQDAAIQTRVVPHKNYKTRSDFEAALQAILKEFEVEIVCLAGFMRVLTGPFVNSWRGRLLNVHPSLLPSFKGMHAQRQALQAKVKISGCSVHFVAEEVDGGAIIVQEAVPVLPGDTEDLLTERIKQAEHKAFPRALEMLALGQVSLADDGMCVWHDPVSQD
ncbi:trifunctional purine biosynthetic protein adenosine-3 Gart [Oratosquilla oratoria]|uniref:trifunctional purine biosynthetic protein adenosine-3 Gart n=1 Tax=Oratosquilla oratoria TaxID=337810 RepID=UPI003F7667F6